MADYLDLAISVLKIIEKDMSKPKARKDFSKSTKEPTMKKQKNRCNDCGKKSKHLDFDHIDGNSSNNSLDNCQALCPNCHAKKTRKSKKREMKLSQMLRKIRKYLK